MNWTFVVGFAGRVFLALLFLLGGIQKLLDPSQVSGLLHGWGLPGVLVWPAMVFNVLGAAALLTGVWLTPMSLALAAYTAFTSFFHLIPDDPWQMSIFVKNWAIAGGLLVLAAYSEDLKRD